MVFQVVDTKGLGSALGFVRVHGGFLCKGRRGSVILAFYLCMLSFDFHPSRISVFLYLKYFGMFHLSSFLEAPYSCCLVHVVGGQLYMWGRVKMTGDNWMYPKPVIGIR